MFCTLFWPTFLCFSQPLITNKKNVISINWIEEKKPKSNPRKIYPATIQHPHRDYWQCNNIIMAQPAGDGGKKPSCNVSRMKLQYPFLRFEDGRGKAAPVWCTICQEYLDIHPDKRRPANMSFLRGNMKLNPQSSHIHRHCKDTEYHQEAAKFLALPPAERASKPVPRDTQDLSIWTIRPGERRGLPKDFSKVARRILSRFIGAGIFFIYFLMLFMFASQHSALSHLGSCEEACNDIAKNGLKAPSGRYLSDYGAKHLLLAIDRALKERLKQKIRGEMFSIIVDKVRVLEIVFSVSANAMPDAGGRYN